MMRNLYDVTYHLVRLQIISTDDLIVSKSDRDVYLRALDTAYAERRPFPLEIKLIWGDPFGPKMTLHTGYENNSKDIPVRGFN